ncbi:ISPsy1 transposase [mine drainage metagenome]|uniref:ISPsy1 transposase n=1 Tax=mine drainage metagenome TaxID=410659 RepID=T0YMG9_9ZZZZ
MRIGFDILPCLRPDQAQCAHHVADLEQSIRNDIDTHNADPKPFVWRKTADAILASVARAATKLI